MSNSSSDRGSPITFGVEIEAVLAFSQEQLRSVLDRYYSKSHTIVKTFPDSVHDCLLNENDYSYQCRNLYPSWGLQVPTEPKADSSLQLVTQKSTSVIGKDGKIRPYLAEPLIIAKEAIESHGTHVGVIAQLRRGVKHVVLDERKHCKSIVLQAPLPDYTNWTITTDHTLIGCLDSQLSEAVGDQAFENITVADSDGTTRTIRQKKWDSSGIELISPVYSFLDKPTAFASITRCLDSLSKSSVHKLIPSTWASLQVHIGLDIENSREIPLSTLQHLAYILICHEDLLSKLHPRIRCGLPLKGRSTEPEEPVFDESDAFDFDEPLPPEKTPAEIAAEDEQYLQANNQRVLVAEASCTGYTTTNSNARYFCHATSTNYPPTPEHVASHVFNSRSNLLDLVSLLQRPSQNSEDVAKGHRYRGYMYNFDNILTMYLEDSNTWKKGKPTIEFRQHACSVDPVEVKRWIELCFAIVKLAQHMAEEETHCTGRRRECTEWRREAQKYATRGQWPCQDIESLLGGQFLKLGKEGVKYWTRRYEQFKDDRPIEQDIEHDVI